MLGSTQWGGNPGGAVKGGRNGQSAAPQFLRPVRVPALTVERAQVRHRILSTQRLDDSLDRHLSEGQGAMLALELRG